jgi:O-antigen/teichoic acid export membrane protein
MIRQFIRDLGMYGASGLISGMLSFFLIPVYVRVLSTVDYGIIDLFSLLAAIASVCLSMEIYQSVARFLPESDGPAKKRIASTGLVFVLFTYAIFVLFMFVFANPFSAMFLGTEGQGHILRLAVGAMLIIGIFHYLQNILRFSLLAKKFAISNLIFSAATISFSLLLVLYYELGLKGVYLGQMAGGAIGIALSATFLRKQLGFSFRFKLLKRMLSFSSPLVFSALAVFALTYTDRWMIRHFISLSDLGIYAVGFRIASIPVLLMGFVTSSFVPIVYNRYKEHTLTKDIALIYQYVFSIGLILITLMSVFAHELVYFIATPEYAKAIVVIPFLVLAGFLLQFSNMFLGLIIANKTRTIALIFFVGVLVSILLNGLLIPIAGIAGAACATACAAVLIFTLLLVFSQKYYFIKLRYFWHLLLLFISVVAVILSHWGCSDTSLKNLLMKSLIAAGYLLLSVWIEGMRSNIETSM